MNFHPIFPEFPIKDIIAPTELSNENISDASAGAEKLFEGIQSW